MSEPALPPQLAAAPLVVPDSAAPIFRKPGAMGWESVSIPAAMEDAQDEAAKQSRTRAEQANEALKNMLLQSLQMQHLVVLAGSGCSLHAGGPSMDELWKAVVGESPSLQAGQAAESSKYNLKDKNIEAFLSQIEAALSVEHNEQTKVFLDGAQNTILEKCSAFLDDKKLLAHGMLLHRLSRRRTRDQRLRVFTTNYDLCFERAAANIGCVAIDGFSFMAPRRYDPRYFDFDIIRRPRSGEDNGNYLEGVFLLYKLHGSVNWEKKDNGIIEKEKPISQKACLIYPASGKYQQSYNQPFIESISQYLAAIREPNTCLLVAGFGFNDDHLSEPLLSAVRSNPHLRLIIVDPKAKENADKGENLANRHLKELFNLSAKGEDVWFINEAFEKFAERIPDLKSLTPAERLLKDIKGIAKGYE
jgi:hypothetical protein